MTESSGKQVSEKKPLAASGAEVIFILLLFGLGIGLCGLVQRNFDSYWPEPTEERAFQSPRIQEKQEELERIENSIKEAEKHLDVVALDQLKQEAVQKTLESMNPALAQRRQETVTNVTTDAERSYETARTQEQTARAVRSALIDRIASLKASEEAVSRELKVEKQMATDKLRGERRRFLPAKFATAVLLPLVIVALAFVAGAALLRWVAAKPVWALKGRRPLLLVSGVLLILLTYQVLEIAGAALIGIIVFLILLQRIKWAPKISS